ncbi:MAG TPA: polysaccharide deacetylase family protein [Candidatus Merdisoma merdipullorum]|nr:polysaccharide deacetylase family protein [Candidatus Merdisoma merdipullorum]
MTAVLGLTAVLSAAAAREFFLTEETDESAGIRAEESTGETVPVQAEAEPLENRKIALTFDDGPHPYYTEQLLDGLAERGVKATFFLLGCNIEGNEDVVRRMAEEGHLIGNHTWYHVDITTLSQEDACAEIQDTSRKITEITGQPVEYVRPPFGNWNKELECEVMMIPIFWSVDTLDWSTENADLIVQEVISEAEENDIILMHDSYKSTVEAALRIIDLLQAEGYEFVTADELILE